MCVDNYNIPAVKLLLKKGASMHIMDLNGEDACDKAFRNGLVREFPVFNDCNVSKKIIPILPNKKHPLLDDLPFFKN